MKLKLKCSKVKVCWRGRQQGASSQTCQDTQQNILSKKQLLDLSEEEANLKYMQREYLSQRSSICGLSLNIFLLKPGLGRSFFVFLFGLGLVFFHELGENSNLTAARKTFFYRNIPFLPPPVIALARSDQELIKSTLLKTEEQDICRVSVCTYSFLPWYFWGGDPACRTPFFLCKVFYWCQQQHWAY